jgi:hypothetical protein
MDRDRVRRSRAGSHQSHYQPNRKGRLRHLQPALNRIAYVARWVPLGPGDVIMSGSPSTFVAVSSGDTVEISVSGVSSLTNRVG